MESIHKTKERLDGQLAGYEGSWAIAGGWAIDFFLGEKTRDHKDLEIAAWRDEQHLLRSFFSGEDCRYYKNGEAFEWREGQTLDPSVHELHCFEGDQELEILLNDRQDGCWTFRRNRQITLPEHQLFMQAALGIPVLAPEVVLLYKSKTPGDDDLHDLRHGLIEMGREQVAWLRNSIGVMNPSHEWLELLKD